MQYLSSKDNMIQFVKVLALFVTRYGQLQDCLQKMVSLLPRVEGVMRAKVWAVYPLL